MDNKTFISRISMQSGLPDDKVSESIATLAAVLGKFCSECDSVAIPGFGTFRATKSDEKVVEQPDGVRMLTPPAITVSFKSSVLLRKALGK